MLIKVLRLTALMAALVILAGCGGSTTSASSSPPAAVRSSPSADPVVAAYQQLVSRIDDMLHTYVHLYCRSMQPSTKSECRDKVVDTIAVEKDAIALLDGATVPDQFKTMHAALRAGLVKDVALATTALNAIDSGKDTQAALTAFLQNYYDNIAPVLVQIRSA